MKQSREWKCGAHRSWFEPPDILWQQFRGMTTLEETRWSVDVYREVASYGPFYVATDVTGAELPPDARKFIAENIRAEWLRGVVYIGAGFVQKAMTKALMVMYLFDKKSPYDIAYAGSMDEARVWIERHRAQRQRQAG